MTFQPSRQFYNVPVSPGNPPHSSIFLLECIFYSSIGFHRKTSPSTSWAITDITNIHSLFKEREMLRYRSRCQDDIFPRIELIPSFVLSSDNTNCKNDIQLFHQLFDELSVHTGLPLTPPGVKSTANSGMTLHSLVLISDSFSCNCNSIQSPVSIVHLRVNLILSHPLLRLYINYSISNANQFQLAQQCIQISTRINSSSVHTYIFVCFTLRVILQGFVTQNATL